MILSSLLTPNVSNFYNLALFVCHLFVDGHFRTSHILYDPNVFHVTQLIDDIQSNCPRTIPWLATDITKELIQPWESDEETDHILQLNIVRLPTKVSDFQSLFTFYRIFIFSSADEKSAQALKFSSDFDLDNMVLRFNHKTGAINVHLFEKNAGENRKIHIFQQNNIDEYKKRNLFEIIFKKYEQNWKIVIKYNVPVNCDESEKIRKTQNTWNGLPFQVNFYASTLKAVSVHHLEKICENPNSTNFHVHQKFPTFYKELSTGYERIDDKNM